MLDFFKEAKVQVAFLFGVFKWRLENFVKLEESIRLDSMNLESIKYCLVFIDDCTKREMIE